MGGASFFIMNWFFSSLVLLMLLVVSCRENQDPEKKGSTVEGRKDQTSLEPSRRGSNSSRKGFVAKSSVPEVNEWLAELSNLKDPGSKRDLFAQIMAQLPPHEHDLALNAVVVDLASPSSANLVSEYLELASLMSPTLQLPGIVRLLQEPGLSLLQRTSMEHLLREELNLPPDENVSDWRPLVEEHLKSLPGVITQ